MYSDRWNAYPCYDFYVCKARDYTNECHHSIIFLRGLRGALIYPPLRRETQFSRTAIRMIGVIRMVLVVFAARYVPVIGDCVSTLRHTEHLSRKGGMLFFEEGCPRIAALFRVIEGPP